MEAAPIIWLVVMVGAFYALVVRPQRRQLTAHRELMGSLAEGDEVMTMGGLFGRIARLGDTVVDLEVAPATSVRVARSAISRKVQVPQ